MALLVSQQAAPRKWVRYPQDLSYGMLCKLLDLSETRLSHL